MELDMKNTSETQTKAVGIMTLSDSMLSGARTEYRTAGYSFPLHLHSAIELYRIVSGECFMHIHSDDIHCKQGDFIMILPNVVHSFYLNDTSDCAFKHIHFNPDMFSDIVLENEGVYPITLMHALLFSSHFYCQLSADDTIDQTMDKLINLYSASNSLFSSANINISLIDLMLYILNQAQPQSTFSKPQLQNSYVAYALNYISKHYAEKIKQEDIAAQLHISVRYLTKLFKSHIGISLSHYINIYRVNQSIERMQNPNLSLTDIALQTGFANSQHYSKVFRDYMNAPPSQYRSFIFKK